MDHRRNKYNNDGVDYRRNLEFVWLENASSTMDEARQRIIQRQNEHCENDQEVEVDNPSILAIATSNQVCLFVLCL